MLTYSPSVGSGRQKIEFSVTDVTLRITSDSLRNCRYLVTQSQVLQRVSPMATARTAKRRLSMHENSPNLNRFFSSLSIEGCCVTNVCSVACHNTIQFSKEQYTDMICEFSVYFSLTSSKFKLFNSIIVTSNSASITGNIH